MHVFVVVDGRYLRRSRHDGLFLSSCPILLIQSIGSRENLPPRAQNQVILAPLQVMYNSTRSPAFIKFVACISIAVRQ